MCIRDRLNFIDDSKGRVYPHFVKGKDRIYLFHNSDGLVSIKWDGTDQKKILKVLNVEKTTLYWPNLEISKNIDKNSTFFDINFFSKIKTVSPKIDAQSLNLDF